MPTKLTLAAITLALAVPAVAFAGPDGKERPSFPMSGEAFLEHVEDRLDTMEERVEERLAKSDKSDAEKEKVRAKIETMASKVMNAANEAAADGTVTKEEAKELRQKMRKAKGRHGKRGKKGARGERLEFPMAGDAFVSHVEQRQAKVSEKIDRRLAKSDLDDARKAEIRAKFAEVSTKVTAAAKSAAADGTVTKEEAKAIRQMVREQRPEKRDGKRGKRGKRDKRDKR
jgi:frataxin-like iron-binding protein CyaY